MAKRSNNDVVNHEVYFDAPPEPKGSYVVDDCVWIHRGPLKGEGNPLQKGKVVHVFELYDNKMYVIEFTSSIEPVYEVRDWFTISPDKNGPIGLFRR